MRDLAHIFRALADETRLKILGLMLKHRELCVCDFVKVLEITQSKASRHLRYLLHAGLLSDRRDGVWAHYRIADDLPHSERAAVLDMVEKLLRARGLDQLENSLSQWLREKQGRAESACVVGTDLTDGSGALS